MFFLDLYIFVNIKTNSKKNLILKEKLIWIFKILKSGKLYIYIIEM